MRIIKKICMFMCVATLAVTTINISTKAALVNTTDNTVFKQSSIPEGKTGKSMNINFSFTADRDYENAFIGLAYDEDLNSSSGEEKEGLNTYPFEASSDTFKRKSVGKIKKGQTRNVTLTAKVRKDVPEGYYSIKVYVSDAKEGGSLSEQEEINVWVKKSVDINNEKEEIKAVNFALGEGQETPRGIYPNVMNFNLNLKNRGRVTAHDVVVSMIMDKDNSVFPFEINEANYDRTFEKISYDEVVSLPYSFAIRKDSYTGYYPIKLKISYKESSDGEVKVSETEFYVHITSKAKEDALSGDFNANNRTKARLIVDGFYTVPDKVIAGEEFELVLNMKNASTSVPASNILFAFEPEKVSESPVFSLENGASSKVVNTLAAGASTEIRLKMHSKPAIEQRSYSLKVNQKFDSPEFKNAEETVNVDIPIYQIAKLKMGNFELTPTEIKVGEDVNVTFPINNTGKVTLYNVSVKFDAPFIKNNEFYIGNIKPAETSNVDVTLTAEGSNSGENTKIIVSYEDESGNVSTVEQDILIPIDEDILAEDTMIDELPTEPLKQENKFKLGLKLIVKLVVALLVVGLLIVIMKKIRSKKQNGES